jgi:hypothetical protein
MLTYKKPKHQHQVLMQENMDGQSSVWTPLSQHLKYLEHLAQETDVTEGAAIKLLKLQP